MYQSPSRDIIHLYCNHPQLTHHHHHLKTLQALPDFNNLSIHTIYSIAVMSAVKQETFIGIFSDQHYSKPALIKWSNVICNLVC